MLELKLSASNAKYSGQTTFYAGINELAAFAADIEGFPQTAEDIRECEFGGTSLSGYGGAEIRLSCKDRSGHLMVHVFIYSNPLQKTGVVESVNVQIEAVPAEIDSFVTQLRGMRAQVGDMASLLHAT